MINKSNYEAWFLDYLEDNLSDEQLSLLESFLDEHPILRSELDDMSLVYIEADDSIYDDKKFELKDELKKTLDPIVDSEDIIIANKEGDITDSESDALLESLKDNKDLGMASAYMEHSYMHDDHISYKHKDTLKKSNYSLDEVDTILLSYNDGTISEFDKKWLQDHFSPTALERQLDKFRKLVLIPDLSITYPDAESLKKEETKVIPIFGFRQWMAIAASFLLLVFGYQFWNNEPEGTPHGTTVIAERQEVPANVKNLENIKTPPSTKTTKTTEHNQSSIDVKGTIISQIAEVSNKEIKPSVYNNISKSPSTRPTYTPNKRTYASTTLTGTVKEAGISTDIIIPESHSVYKRGIIDELPRLIESRTIAVATQSITPIYIITDRSVISRAPYIIPSSRNVLNEAIASLDKDEEESSRTLNLGAFELEVPELLIASVEALQNSKDSYDKGREEGRSIFSFALGSISFYQSRGEE